MQMGPRMFITDNEPGFGDYEQAVWGMLAIIRLVDRHRDEPVGGVVGRRQAELATSYAGDCACSRPICVARLSPSSVV